VRELERVQRAYDAIADDAAAHDAGAAALLLRLNAEEPPAEEPQLPRIFVSVVSYRDPEAVHTLEDLFEKAAHPERVFVGVVWQYVTALPKNDGGGKVRSQAWGPVTRERSDVAGYMHGSVPTLHQVALTYLPSQS